MACINALYNYLWWAATMTEEQKLFLLCHQKMMANKQSSGNGTISDDTLHNEMDFWNGIVYTTNPFKIKVDLKSRNF